MKKLLGLLGAIGLVATTSATVVACGDDTDKTPENPEPNKPIIDAINDLTINVGETKEITIKIQNKIDGEKPKFEVEDKSIVEVIESEANKVTFKALKVGSTKVTVDYKDADSISFDVMVKNVDNKPSEKIELDKLEWNLGCIKDISNEKTKLEELDENDKTVLLKKLLKSSNINQNLDEYIKEIEIVSFEKKRDKEEINRYFDIKSKQNSEKVSGQKEGIFFRTETLNFNDNRLLSQGTLIPIDDINKEDWNDKEMIKEVILKYFIELNKDGNPISIKDIDIEKGTAKNSNPSYNNRPEVVIESKPGQENNSGKLIFMFDGLSFENTKINDKDISLEKLFN